MIKGQNLRLALTDGSSGATAAYLAAAKNCTIDGDAQTEDSTTKDTPTGKTEETTVSKSYTLHTDGLIVDAEDAAAWLDAVGEVVDYSYDLTKGTDNSTQDTALREGKAIITKVSVGAQDRQNATIAIDLKEIYVPTA